MRIVKTWEQAATISKGMVLALGNFDGLHLGHQALLKSALEIKTPEEVLALMVFNPHPQYILADQGPLKITTTDELITVLKSWAVDFLLEMPFNREFAHLSAEAFIKHLLKYLPITTIVVGYNYRFGHQAMGDTQALQALGRQYGFKVIVVPAVRLGDGQIISSTTIRQKILQGNLAQAEALLGRPFMVRGAVIKGYQRGHQMGFPTANLQLCKHKILPPFGVYVGHVNANLALINLGLNPTFNNQKQSLEVHILDYPYTNLYGETLEVEFLKFIRHEKKFASISDLRQQIMRDIQEARRMK